jgi:hypothetical protein
MVLKQAVNYLGWEGGGGGCGSVFLHIPVIFKFLRPSICQQMRETFPFNTVL